MDHWDMVTESPQNPQTKVDFSDNRVTEADVSGGQTSLKIIFDEQTPEEVKRGILSQVLLASIRSQRSAIGSVELGSDMTPDVANVIEHTLTKPVTVINTVADMGSLGSDFSNWSSLDHITLQRFYTEILYDEYTSEYRYLSTGDIVQLWDK